MTRHMERDSGKWAHIILSEIDLQVVSCVR
jgi:hypothetical protein